MTVQHGHDGHHSPPRQTPTLRGRELELMPQGPSELLERQQVSPCHPQHPPARTRDDRLALNPVTFGCLKCRWSLPQLAHPIELDGQLPLRDGQIEEELPPFRVHLKLCAGRLRQERAQQPVQGPLPHCFASGVDYPHQLPGPQLPMSVPSFRQVTRQQRPRLRRACRHLRCVPPVIH